MKRFSRATLPAQLATVSIQLETERAQRMGWIGAGGILDGFQTAKAPIEDDSWIVAVLDSEG